MPTSGRGNRARDIQKRRLGTRHKFSDVMIAQASLGFDTTSCRWCMMKGRLFEHERRHVFFLCPALMVQTLPHNGHLFLFRTEEGAMVVHLCQMRSRVVHPVHRDEEMPAGTQLTPCDALK